MNEFVELKNLFSENETKLNNDLKCQIEKIKVIDDEISEIEKKVEEYRSDECFSNQSSSSTNKEVKLALLEEKKKIKKNKDVRRQLKIKKNKIEDRVEDFEKHKLYYLEIDRYNKILKSGGEEITFNELQDLCYMIMEIAFYYKDQPVVKKFFFGEGFADKVVEIQDFRPKMIRAFYVKNYTRVNQFLGRISSNDVMERDSALKEFNDNPYKFIVDKNSKYLSDREGFDYGIQLKEQLRKIKDKEELDAVEVFESVLNHHYQSGVLVYNVPRLKNRIKREEINKKLFSFYSKLTVDSMENLNERVDSSHLISENEKKDLLGEVLKFYSILHHEIYKKISDLNKKIRGLNREIKKLKKEINEQVKEKNEQVKEKKEQVKEKEEQVKDYKKEKSLLSEKKYSYDLLMQKAIAYLAPLWQIPGNTIETTDNFKKTAVTADQQLNYKQALAAFSDTYSKSRYATSRPFRNTLKEIQYDVDFRDEQIEIRDLEKKGIKKTGAKRSDNVGQDHTRVPLPDGRFFDGSFQPLGDQKYIGCHAPHNQKSSSRYYQVMLNENIETVVSLTERMEKSNLYDFYVNSQTPFKVFKDGDRKIEVKWLEDVADECEDLGKTEQIKVRKIQVKETVNKPGEKTKVRIRILHQICLKGWRDHGLVPPKVMEQLAKAVYKYNIDEQGKQKATLMGHCHGGVGRWGTTLLSLHYYKQFERLKRKHLSFKVKLTNLKKIFSGENYRSLLLNTMTTMLDNIYDSKKVELNRIGDKETRIKEIDLLEEYYEKMNRDIHNLGSIAKKEKLAEILLSTIEKETENLTFNIQEDLFRLRLMRDAVQGPEQLASIYNFVTHLYDNYYLKINPEYQPRAQQSLRKKNEFNITGNCRRLAILQNDYWVERHKPSKKMDKEEKKNDFQDFLIMRAESIRKIIFRDLHDNEIVGNITDRFCGQHKTALYFLKAMEDANISYLDLDKMIVENSKSNGLRPGISLSRMLFHSNFHDLIKVVHKVSPDLFKKLGSLLKSVFHVAISRKSMVPGEKSIANWLRVTIPIELKGACLELLISFLSHEKEEICKKLTNQQASSDDKEQYREELAIFIGLLPTQKQDYYMRCAIETIEKSNIDCGKRAIEKVNSYFSRERSFSKEILTELGDRRHVIDSVDCSDYEKGMKESQQTTAFFANHYTKSKSGNANVETKNMLKANNQSFSVNNHSTNSSSSSSSSTFWSSTSSSSINQSSTHEGNIFKKNFSH